MHRQVSVVANLRLKASRVLVFVNRIWLSLIRTVGVTTEEFCEPILDLLLPAGSLSLVVDGSRRT